MDFTGLSVLALLRLGVSFLRIQAGSFTLGFYCLNCRADCICRDGFDKR